MTTLAVVAVGILVLVAVVIGAYVAVVVAGGDPTLLGTIAAAGVAFLGGIIVAETLRRRRDG